VELRPGYRQTEVGVIPEEWDAACLGDRTSKVGSGITPTGGEKVYRQEGRPFLRSQNVGWGTLLIEDIAFIDEATHETFKATEIKTDDVFLNITGASIGRSAVADARVARGNVNQHVCIIRTDQDQLHPRFLNHFLLSKAGQRQIDSFQAGGNRQGLNFAQIRSFCLPVPPLPEQRAIAEALGHVDALLGALTQLIAKKRDLKQAAMHQLLTGQIRLPGFSGEWESTSFGKVFSRVHAKENQIQTSEYQVSGALPVVDQGKEPVVGFSDREDKRFRCPEGGVVIFGDHTCIVKFVEFDFVVGADGTQILATKTGHCARFHAFQLQLREIPTTGYNRHFKFLKERPFRAPPHPEQTAIAAVLSDMDAEVAALEKRLAKTRALKQGMMQELLTGRTRLV
jgi:type I restriction enzyme S subunit